MKKISKKLALLLMVTMALNCFGIVTFAETNETSKLPVKVTENETTKEQIKVNSNVIDIVSFNDFHGNLAEDVSERGKNIGMAKMISAAKEYKVANPNTIIVSGGDNYQGSAMSNLTQGAPVNQMFKAMDVQVSAVGNHEFDWGTSYMEKWQEDGGFKYLAANIVDEATGEVVSWAKPYSITEMNGKKIAFIGLATTTTPTVTASKNVEGLVFEDSAKTAAEWVEFLEAGKAEEGVPDAIVAVTHIAAHQDKYGTDTTLPITGEEIEALANVEGIDAIVSGHSHTTVAGYINNTPVVQAYKYGRAMAKISLEFNEDGTIKSAVPCIDSLYKRKGDIIPDNEGVTTYEEWNTKLGPVMDEKVGTATATFTHDAAKEQTTMLGEFVCKIMAEKAGVDIAIQNGGGLRRDMPKGDITMGIMYEIMPFDNTLTVVELTGADLKKNIDNGLKPEAAKAGSFSGLYVEYDLDKPAGERISKITLLDGTPIEMDKTYKVVSNDFLVGTKYADGYDFTNVKSLNNLQLPIRDVMVDYIKAKGSVTPENNSYEVNVTGKEKVTEEKKVNYIRYVVKEGDVLWKIAEKYGLTYQELGDFNKIANYNLIYVNQELNIPQ